MSILAGHFKFQVTWAMLDNVLRRNIEWELDNFDLFISDSFQPLSSIACSTPVEHWLLLMIIRKPPIPWIYHAGLSAERTLTGFKVAEAIYLDRLLCYAWRDMQLKHHGGMHPKICPFHPIPDATGNEKRRAHATTLPSRSRTLQLSGNQLNLGILPWPLYLSSTESTSFLPTSPRYLAQPARPQPRCRETP